MTPGHIREFNRLASLRSQLASAGKGRTADSIKARLKKSVDAQEKLMEQFGETEKLTTKTETIEKVKTPSKVSAKKS